MKRYLMIGLLAIQACVHSTKEETGTAPEQDTIRQVALADSADPDEPEDYPHDANTDSAKISGDFNGDGKTEFAWAVISKPGHGNPMENGESDEFSLQFSDPVIPEFRIGCCEVRLFNEGDLNHDGADEISIYQAPDNGNTYTFSTYTFKGDNWKTLFAPFLVPTGGDPVSDEDLENRVILENDSLFFYDVDFSDEHFKLVKKYVPLK